MKLEMQPFLTGFIILYGMTSLFKNNTSFMEQQAADYADVTNVSLKKQHILIFEDFPKSRK